MADFEPAPRLNPFFKGLFFALGITVLAMAAWGMFIAILAAIRFFLALP